METTHGMEFEDHLAAIETIVRRLERGDMRLNEALVSRPRFLYQVL